jgi:hypothetical protein
MPAALVAMYTGIEQTVPIYLVGADDQGVDWSAFTPEELCGSVIDGAEYRAIRRYSDLGCAMITLLDYAYQDFQGNQGRFYRDRYLFQKRIIDGARALRAL